MKASPIRRVLSAEFAEFSAQISSVFKLVLRTFRLAVAGIFLGGLAKADQLISTTTFTNPGVSTYTVPVGTSYLVVKCWGAGGGNWGMGGFSYGGMGGFVQGKLSITSGTWNVLVGSPGGNGGGYGGSGGGSSEFGYYSIGFGAGGGGGGSGGADGLWYNGGDGGWSNSTYPTGGVSGGAEYGGEGGVNGQSNMTVTNFVSISGNNSGDPHWASPAGLGSGYIDFEGHAGRVVVMAYQQSSLPALASPGSPSHAQRQTVSYQISATGVPAITSYAASGLPPGLSVNTTTGLITGMPLTPGSYTATISATNPVGTSSATFTWTVVAAAIVTNASSSPGAVQVGQSLTLFRAGSANFGVAYTETTIWKPNGPGQYDSLGVLPLGSSTYTPTAGPGTYTVQFRIVDNYFNYRDQSYTFDVTPQLQTLPYTTGYELAESYNPGSLHLQNGWLVPLGSANVATEQAQQGAYGLKLVPGSQLTDVKRYFSSNQNWAFVDVYVRPIATAAVQTSSIMDYGASRIGFVTVSAGQGAIYAYDGNGNGSGTWRDTLIRFPVDGAGQSTGWIRLTVRHDYSAHDWDFYANGVLIDYDLGMVANSATSFTDLNWWGHATSVAYFDRFTASTTNPLFTDVDHDGMDDAWESANGLNPALNDRNSDLDSDGRSNIQEYFAGTKPNNADITVPLAPASFQITANAINSLSFSWSGASDPGGAGTTGVAGYNVYRNGVKLNGALLTGASFTETGLSANTAYTYTVRAVDLAGNVSAQSAPLVLTTVVSSTAGSFELFTPTP